jgi:hypothetical protein
MRRHAIGILALLLVAGAVFFWIWPPAPQDAFAVQSKAACWRMGALLCALWLAYPHVSRIPRWMLMPSLVLLVVLARWPRLLLIAVPIVIVLAILKPRVAPRR